MKNYFLITITFLLLTSTAYSRIFRVGYNGTPLKGVDYSSITEVNDSVAKAGDTIQIYGTHFGGRINKRLVILGFGYNFVAHPELQSNPGLQSNETNNLSRIYDLSLEVGSDSSIIEGCNINSNSTLCLIKSQKVIIRRCSGDVRLYNYYNSVNDLKVISCNNFSVQMYFDIQPEYGYPCKNINIYNSIGVNLYLYGNESNGAIINCVNSSPSGDKSKFLVKNCIGSYSSAGNTIWDNNVFNNAEPTPPLPGMNNKFNQNLDSVYVKPNSNPTTGTLDENNYQLRPNSPAKNFGIDFSGKPTDCGIFGGELAYRYKIAGQPAIPAFYKLSAPTNAATANPYNITVSVRSNN